jgi:hypothetical protein
MNHFSIVVDIAAPPDRVWAVMTDVERWPEWTPTVTRIQRLDDGPLTVGSRARVRQPRLPTAVWQVSELLEGRSFTWVSHSPGVRVTAEHGVEPTAGGTRAKLSVQFSGVLAPLVARLTRRLNERYLALEAKGLSERSTRSLGSPPIVGGGAA